MLGAKQNKQKVSSQLLWSAKAFSANLVRAKLCLRTQPAKWAARRTELAGFTLKQPACHAKFGTFWV